MDQTELKRRAAAAALDELVEGSIVGVGSGSTVDLFIDLLGERRERFAGAVSSSERSTARLRAAGIEVLDLNEVVASGARIPVYVDGADEVDAARQMVKGGGGALTREKIVASACERFVCIVDATKVKATLGAFAIPVEVIPMAREVVARRLRELGGQPTLRDFTTDNGNVILDVAGWAMDAAKAREMESVIDGIPGVVTNGLFARKPADLVLVAKAEGVERY